MKLSSLQETIKSNAERRATTPVSHSARVANPAEAPVQPSRFDDAKWDVGSIHGFKVSGDLANRILDAVPGSSVKQVRDVLFEANKVSDFVFKENTQRSGIPGNNGISPARVASWCIRKLSITIAMQKYGTPEELAGGKPAAYTFEIDSSIPEKTVQLSTEFAVITEGFLSRMRAQYPKAFKDSEGNVSTITMNTIEKLVNGIFEHGRNLSVYGPEGQKMVENGIEALFSNRHSMSMDAEARAKDKDGILKKVSEKIVEFVNGIPFEVGSKEYA
jgi:hypothetical protein